MKSSHNAQRCSSASANEPSPQAVIATTSAIVKDALHGNWLAVLDNAEERRRLLERLEPKMCGHAGATLKFVALRDAVYESERAIAKIIAHAVISQQSGGEAAFH